MKTLLGAAAAALALWVAAATPATACGGNQCPSGGGRSADYFGVGRFGAEAWGDEAHSWGNSHNWANFQGNRLWHGGSAEAGASAYSGRWGENPGSVSVYGLSAVNLGYAFQGFNTDGKKGGHHKNK